MSARRHDNYILQAWLCITLALFFGALLAGVQAALGPVIAENKINETKEKVPELVFGADAAVDSAGRPALEITPSTIRTDHAGGTRFYSVFEARFADGTPAGWVTKASGQGYADRIELLVGLTPDADRISGLYILDQKETPGLGNKIVEVSWRNQFIRKPTDQPLKVVKRGARAPEEIDAVSGATISSDSVVAIVNRVVSDMKTHLAQGPLENKE
ncbi:MAG: FMN-binding protein [Desulfatitalea sp.]|nr:FMN-binding protein [Desulfatitalea sp.]NNJ98859.1 FMN-binding protein [Desulfatitalea sp.]